jgi:hypothetical protein
LRQIMRRILNSAAASPAAPLSSGYST